MKLIENAKSLVILIIIAIASIGLGYYKFFYLPDKLKETVRDQSVAIGTVQKSNETLLEGIAYKQDSETLKELVVEEGEKIKKELAEKGYNDSVRVSEHVTAIKAEYGKQIEQNKDPEKTAALVLARERAISKTRIDSLWTSYCRNEPLDPDCRSYK
jgi:acyl carrier protein